MAKQKWSSHRKWRLIINPRIHAILIAIRNLLIGGNLASLSLLTKPRRMALYATDNLFFLRSIMDRRGVPQSNVFDIFPQVRSAEIELSNCTGDTWLGNVPSFTADIVSLCLLCRAVKPKTVFEIGTFNGYSAAHLALNTPDDCSIYTLDLPPAGQTSRQLSVTDGDLVKLRSERKMYSWERTSAAGKIRTLCGDSMTFDFSPYHGKIDLFFIDGAHSYEYVRSDTLNALKCCHPGSVIAWHDFGRMGVNGVSRWLREFSGQQEVYSIPGGSLCFTPPLPSANPRSSATPCLKSDSAHFNSRFVS